MCFLLVQKLLISKKPACTHYVKCIKSMHTNRCLWHINSISWSFSTFVSILLAKNLSKSGLRQIKKYCKASFHFNFPVKELEVNVNIVSKEKYVQPEVEHQKLSYPGKSEEYCPNHSLHEDSKEGSSCCSANSVFWLKNMPKYGNFQSPK
jgi:hypothetical protein